LDAFKQTLESRHVPSRVKSTEDLVTGVLAAVSNHLQNAGMATGAEQLSDLPYLVDRDPQTTAVERALVEAGDKRGLPPVAFILPGLHVDLHGGLIRRYETFHVLPGTDANGIDGSTPIEWPDRDDAGGRFAEVCRQLNQSLGLADDAPPERTQAVLRSFGRPRLFSCILPAANWRRDDPEVLHRWFQFWRDTRSDRGNQPMLFMCLSFERDDRPGWLRLPTFGSAAGPPGARRWLKMVGLTAPDVHVLPPLELIRPSHLEIWAQSRCAQQRKDLDVALLSAEVLSADHAKQPQHLSHLLGPMREALAKAWTPARRERT
jgi:hypothetical protein